MCGIIGMIGENGISSNIYLGLLALQHRGQDACGICVRDGDKFRLVKDKGLVGEVFDENKLSSFSGNMGIGHVRYTTAGSNDRKSAQPFLVKMPVPISISMNGNTINHQEIVDYLWDNNISLESSSDTEAILSLFKLELKKVMERRDSVTRDEVFSAAKKLMEMVRGSYSMVLLVDGLGLLAIRDPYSLRPLVFGKSKAGAPRGYVFASESVAIDILDMDVLGDVHGGEAILVDNDYNVERRTLATVPKRAHCMFEYVYFARPDSLLDFSSVYEVRLSLGRELAQVWPGHEVDVVIAAPDTSRTAALAFAESIGVKYREGLIKNRYIGRTFIMPTQAKRSGAIRIKINPIISEVRGKRVALVDDSIVRGTTGKKTVELLRNAGAKEVHFLSSCPPILNPCVYGVDMPTYDELIAHKKNVEDTRKMLGADSLTYLDLDGLKRAIGIDHLCTACLTGEYPVAIDPVHLSEMGERRKKEKKE